MGLNRERLTYRNKILLGTQLLWSVRTSNKGDSSLDLQIFTFYQVISEIFHKHYIFLNQHLETFPLTFIKHFFQRKSSNKRVNKD